MSNKLDHILEEYAYNAQQKHQLRLADNDHLDLNYLKSPKYDWEQMREIRLCLAKGINPTQLCNPEIPSEAMEHIRKELFENNAIYDKEHEEVEKKKLKRLIITFITISLITVVCTLAFWKRETIRLFFIKPKLELTSSEVKIGISKAPEINYMDYVKHYDKKYQLILPEDKLDRMKTYNVTYRIRDGVNTEKKYLVIHVTDDIAPTLELTQNEVEIEYGSSFNAASYIKTAKDNAKGDHLLHLVQINNTVKNTTPGIYTVTYQLSDDSSNIAKRELHVKVLAKKEEKQISSPSSQRSPAASRSSKSASKPSIAKPHSIKVTAASKTFMFSDASNMNQTYQKAMAYAKSQLNSGKAHSYNVEPIQNSEGIYIGYEVTFS